jgi:hypothetical protein
MAGFGGRPTHGPNLKDRGIYHASDAMREMYEMGDAPSCSTCGAIMVRNGSCYRCMSCGSTSGCSSVAQAKRGCLNYIYSIAYHCWRRSQVPFFQGLIDQFSRGHSSRRYPMTNLLRSQKWENLLAAFMVVSAQIFAGSFLVQPAQLKAQVSREKAAQLRHAHSKPMLTGIDGAQTGTASFQGNFTTITTPSGALSIFREPNCSLTLATGTYSIDPSFTYTETELTPNYERILHTEAQLTTTPDVFASGCAIQPAAGFGSQLGIFVGRTPSQVNVFAGVGPVYPSFTEGVYLLTGTTTFDLSSFQYSPVGNLTAADLNKDGNGDLVITDSSLATSARVTVMLGKSDGTFKSGVPYSIAGDYSVAAVIDDVNGDGKLDIVAVSGDQQISVLLGNGDGTFQAAKSFAAPALPGYPSAASTPIVNLITADLRGNNKKDIICSNGLVLLGNGDGTFTAVAAPAFPYYQDPLYAGGPESCQRRHQQGRQDRPGR